MEIISENINDGKGLMDQMIQKAINYLSEMGGKALEHVKKEYVPLLGTMVQNLTGELKGVVFGKEVDELDMTTLVNFAKRYIVSNSNEIVALKSVQNDGVFIYLTYAKDKQLLPISSNKYLVIKAKSLAIDVEELFVESELVILK